MASISQKIGKRQNRSPASRRTAAKRPPTPATRRSIQKVLEEDAFRPAAALPVIEEESQSLVHGTRKLASATIAITTATTAL